MTITMDESFSKTVGGKSLRPVRNRRYSRKSFAVGQRPVKRLFTPEIKRFLKEWLIRRRDNPYPNREEKKLLAVETGLTYIQICNWFANWRRKLKNAGNERNRRTWGHLIKNYNNNAQGNVEQFSICSDDSIWEESDPLAAEACDKVNSGFAERLGCPKTSPPPEKECKKLPDLNRLEISRAKIYHKDQCYHISSTTEEFKSDPSSLTTSNSGNKYKSHIMEKYLKGLQTDMEKVEKFTKNKPEGVATEPVLLNKWLESAAKFQPCESNYVTWNTGVRSRNEKRRKTLPKGNNRDLGSGKDRDTDNAMSPAYRSHDLSPYSMAPAESIRPAPTEYQLMPAPAPLSPYDSCMHGREEVEAAVALTRLATLFRS